MEESLLKTSKAIDEMDDKKQNLELEITRLQMQVSNLKNQLRHFFETRNILQGSVDNDKKSLQDQAVELEENRLRIEQIQKDNAVLEQDLLNIKTTEAKFSDIILDVEKQRQDAHQALENNRCILQKIREEIESLRNKNRDTEIKIMEIDHCIDSIRMYIESTYHIDIDLTVEDRDENWDDIRLKIDQSKQRIAQMGEVNMAAIEENKELKSRFDFLTQQHDDLVKSKDSLLKTIDRIDKTARQMFIETFEKIKENFKIYFKQLFEGGEADILFLDPSDALTSGIEIVARPPGKKLQTIALLSGGEKALTAVAILFAIFRVKPSPFCVLDEIDATLDESNIGRFTALLREFAKDSQFIIITHNKKTIEIADVIYGVTMPEYGTSRMVSVKFK
jgi:chromosome segregation protein